MQPDKPEDPLPYKSDIELLNQDPYLRPHEYKIRERLNAFNHLLETITSTETSILTFAHSYTFMGLHLNNNNDVIYKEYAPNAKSISLFGDFNNWNRNEYKGQKDKNGLWTITIPNKNGVCPIPHNTKLKANVCLSDSITKVDRNPIWSRYLIQNKDSYLYDSVFWNPPLQYEWKSKHIFIQRKRSLRIYEAHVGMSSIDCKVSTYREFADTIIPRIKDTGYNAIQLMAIMEHVDYASFGYHVTNFFAIASRSGTPDDLKYLIDIAHQNDLMVLIDIVHSHASCNQSDGISNWDGTDYLYFHSGSKGKHELWDSRLFNYANHETLRLLLSNCAFYQEEYHFDGFRFDGVTSILYKHHGIRYGFTGNYNEYFNDLFDLDGGVYTMLANYLIHLINPNAITIAEDVSGIPGLCRPIKEGGFGFDYRLNMSIADKWIHIMRDIRDEDWDMGNITYTLTNRRHNEKHVGYCESHDQSIVGDKTISMWLFDKEIYWNMSVLSEETLIINRGMCLHKMIRLITFALGGEAYLNFMGNEFGHPEWVDFPRPGNDFSYNHCRRRWDLVDDKVLRYRFLYKWDCVMNNLDEVFCFLPSQIQHISCKDEETKIIVFEKGDLLFVFNFNTTKCFEHYKVGTPWRTPHKIVIDSDESRFMGKDRLTYGHDNFFPCMHDTWQGRPNYIQIYIPNRTCMVLIAEENMNKYDFKKLIK